eukprot:CAMPEP_0167748756 /NCGR_PEP_ID=MMETSP0110_2-20121227/5015_1 /TAXON_ID=629695 /ORGANISM="Gymnochlora sp., Strain CCMP2014" /LENGTH=288 /DNA_ID=CAMNT_0007633807 /DNA_START=138 /DNA_END=1004 /DNA_ORIENTATION=-
MTEKLVSSAYGTKTQRDTLDSSELESSLLKREERFYEKDNENKDKFLFCYAVVNYPRESTFYLVEEMMKKCDGYRFFSNFSDPSHKVMRLINAPMKVPYGGKWGSALNTPHFHKVWKYMATNKNINSYKWFLKVDLDTIFYPERMKTLIRNRMSDHSQSIAWGFPIPGPAELFSQGSLQMFGEHHADICDKRERLTEKWEQEDMYIWSCLRTLGYENHEPAGQWRWDGILPNDVFKELRSGKANICYGKGKCLVSSKMANLAVFHPFKTPYKMQVMLDWLGKAKGTLS